MNSEQKMREALEQIKALTEIPFAHTAGDHELIYQLAREALAEPSGNSGEFAAPAGGQVGLTDADIRAEWQRLGGPEKWLVDFGFQQFARAVIAKYEAKRGGAA